MGRSWRSISLGQSRGQGGPHSHLQNQQRLGPLKATQIKAGVAYRVTLQGAGSDPAEGAEPVLAVPWVFLFHLSEEAVRSSLRLCLFQTLYGGIQEALTCPSSSLGMSSSFSPFLPLLRVWKWL